MRLARSLSLVLSLVLVRPVLATGEITGDDIHQVAPRAPGAAVVEATAAEPEAQNTARYSTAYWTNDRHYGWNSAADDYWGRTSYHQLGTRYAAVDVALYRLETAYGYGSWQANQTNRIRRNGRTIYNRYRYSPDRNNAWSLETWLNFYESYLRSYGYLGSWNYPYNNRTTYYTNPNVWSPDTGSTYTYSDYSPQRVNEDLYWGNTGSDSTFTRGPGASTGGDLEFRLAPEVTGGD